jgi:hypothetical protein
MNWKTIFHLTLMALLLIALAFGMYHLLSKEKFHPYDVAVPSGVLGNIGQELEIVSLSI